MSWTSSGLTICSLILWSVGLFWALIFSPPDFQQGEVMRILYIHVPVSWAALGILTVMAGASGVFLIWKRPRADLLAEALAPLGCAMTGLSLLTGALWGKPVWGTFWVWDARLTLMLVLLFLYGGVVMLRRAFASPFDAKTPVALFTLMAWLNIPLIKGSVYWFHTLHQPPSLLRTAGPTLHLQMLFPLLVMATALGLTLWIFTQWRLESLRLRLKMRAQWVRNPGHLIWQKEPSL